MFRISVATVTTLDIIRTTSTMHRFIFVYSSAFASVVTNVMSPHDVPSVLLLILVLTSSVNGAESTGTQENEADPTTNGTTSTEEPAVGTNISAPLGATVVNERDSEEITSSATQSAENASPTQQRSTVEYIYVHSSVFHGPGSIVAAIALPPTLIGAAAVIVSLIVVKNARTGKYACGTRTAVALPAAVATSSELADVENRSFPTETAPRYADASRHANSAEPASVTSLTQAMTSPRVFCKSNLGGREREAGQRSRRCSSAMPSDDVIDSWTALGQLQDCGPKIDDDGVTVYPASPYDVRGVSDFGGSVVTTVSSVLSAPYLLPCDVLASAPGAHAEERHPHPDDDHNIYENSGVENSTSGVLSHSASGYTGEPKTTSTGRDLFLGSVYPEARASLPMNLHRVRAEASPPVKKHHIPNPCDAPEPAECNFAGASLDFPRGGLPADCNRVPLPQERSAVGVSGIELNVQQRYTDKAPQYLDLGVALHTASSPLAIHRGQAVFNFEPETSQDYVNVEKT